MDMIDFDRPGHIIMQYILLLIISNFIFHSLIISKLQVCAYHTACVLALIYIDC